MADLVILGGMYLLVQALLRLGDWYQHDGGRLMWSAGVYSAASLFVTWWYAAWFVTIITPAVAVLVPILLGMTVLGAYYATRLQPPWQLREDLYLSVRLGEIAHPVWRTVAVQAFVLLWQNVLVVTGLLLLLGQGLSIWFVLGTFLMVLASLGVALRVWREVAWYVPWLIFTFTLPALVYVVLFFPLGFAWLLLFQIVAYVALHAEVEVHQIEQDDH